MSKANEFLKAGDGYVDVTLSRPADIGGVKSATLRMREPTVADQEAASVMSGTDASREIAVFANLCSIAPDDIRKMPVRDYNRLQKAYMGFID